MKRCMPVNASNGKKQTLAILVVTLMGTILAFGGILTTIVVILLYPIALAVFEQADIPKKFILGVLANGTFTFALTMPGSPQVTNIVAMNFLGTSSTAALIPGLVGAAVEIVVVLIIMNKMINKARAAGEHFSYDPKDNRYDPEKKKPSMIAALAPLVLLFVMFNVLHVAIEICLAVSVIVALALFFPFLREEGILKVANQGAVNALAPICTVGAVVGFAGVVSSTAAFQSIVDAVLGMSVPPMLLMIVCTVLLYALTGGSATGLTVCLPMIGPYVVNTLGIAPSVVHRVCTFAATTIDTLPYSGAILMFLPISHMKLKEVYPATFVTTVISTTAGTIAVALICWLFPALA